MNKVTGAALPLAATIAISLIAVPSPAAKGGKGADPLVNPGTQNKNATMLKGASPLAQREGFQRVPQGLVRRSEFVASAPAGKGGVNGVATTAGTTIGKLGKQRRALNLGMRSIQAGRLAEGGIAGATPDFATCFEAGDGYALGQLHGQNGWVSFQLNEANTTIFNASPIQGAQSVYAPLGSGQNFNGSFSPPSVLVPDSRYIGEVDVNPASAGGPNYQVIFGETIGATAGNINITARVFFYYTDFDGDAVGPDLVVLTTGGAPQVIGQWTPGSQRLRCEVNPDTGNIDYFINSVWRGRAGIPFLPVAGISGAVLFHDDFAGGPIDEVRFDCLETVSINAGCRQDIVWDNVVNIDDLLAVISGWGPCPAPPPPCFTDLVGAGSPIPDGTTNIDDLLDVISAWGACPTPTGACCVGAACNNGVTRANCIASGGSYRGNGVPCAAVTCVVNDACSTATNIGLGVTTQDNSNASTSPGGQPPSCSFGLAPVTNDLWFRYTNATASAQLVRADTCSTIAIGDTVITMYASCADGSMGNEVACNDDACGSSGLLSSTFTSVAAGQSVLIRVGSWNGGPTGDIVLTLTEIFPPANDSCSAAIDITASINGADVAGDNTVASPAIGGVDPELPLGSPSCQWAGLPDATHSTVWYTFIAPATGCITVDFCSTSGTIVDTVLALYTGSCGSLTEVTCEEDTVGCVNFYSRMRATGLTPGATYRLMVGNPGAWAGSIPGTYTFSISDACPPPPPANDSCASPIDITANINGADVTGDNTSATPAAGGIDTELPFGSPSCHWAGLPDASHSTVWYTFTAPASGCITVTTCGTGGSIQDTILALYTGSCGALTEVGCGEDDVNCINFYSTLQAAGLTPGATYVLMLGNPGAWAGAIAGSYSFSITDGCPPPPPANDECGGATPVGLGLNVTSNVNSTTSSVTPANPSCPLGGEPNFTLDVWHTYTNTSGGPQNLTIDTCGAGTFVFDTALAVYSGTCASLAILNCNDDFCGTGLQSSLTVSVANGQTILIRVGSWANSVPGSIDLTLTP